MKQNDIPQLIEVNPAIMMGKPVIRGTRITVELILEKLAAGETIDDLLTAFPALTDQKIKAALLYASLNLKSDFIYPIAI